MLSALFLLFPHAARLKTANGTMSQQIINPAGSTNASNDIRIFVGSNSRAIDVTGLPAGVQAKLYWYIDTYLAGGDQGTAHPEPMHPTPPAFPISSAYPYRVYCKASSFACSNRASISS